MGSLGKRNNIMAAYQARPRWTARQLNYLVENWDTMKDEDIANTLGRTLKSVRRKRERLELKKACGRGIVAKATSSNETSST